MPVAEKLGDVGKLIGQAGEIDADLAQLTLNIARVQAAQARGDGEIAIRGIDGRVEDAVVRFELGELEVRQLHDVEDLIEVARLIDDQGGVPVHHDEVALVVGQIFSGRL